MQRSRVALFVMGALIMFGVTACGDKPEQAEAPTAQKEASAPAPAPAVQAPPAGDQGGAGGTFTEALKTEGMQGAEQNMDAMTAAMGSGKAVVPFSELKVDKAEGADSYRVKEVFEKAAELNGKTVVVRGQVMKVSSGIMGKNWLHIQDGTGDPAANTHDLVVTSAEVPEKGEVVIVQGLMSKDKDFGFGYKYAVIVEDATIRK